MLPVGRKHRVERLHTDGRGGGGGSLGLDGPTDLGRRDGLFVVVVGGVAGVAGAAGKVSVAIADDGGGRVVGLGLGPPIQGGHVGECTEIDKCAVVIATAVARVVGMIGVSTLWVVTSLLIWL